MAYIRYKAVTRDFNFTKVIDTKDIPSYGKDYIYGDEKILAAYNVGKDIGLITDKKIILFDNSTSFGARKEVTTIPYKSVTAHSIIFYGSRTEIYLLLETSNPLLLKFSNMEDKDKYRLRLIYNAMSAVICGQEIPNEITKKLTDKDLEIKK
jgi:hypothetical protein